MGDHGPRIDHIILAASDLKAAVDDLYKEYGLAAYQGGRHQGWGTENWIVPLKGAYLEIAAVFDEPVARNCDWGRLIIAKAATSKPWSLVTFCVETPEGALATANRLGAETAPMLRLRPDGSPLTWRVAAMSRFSEPVRAPLPFFITWDDPSIRPDRASSAAHQAKAQGITFIELSGDADAMSKWIGPEYINDFNLRWVDGTPDIRAVGIETEDKGTIVLRTP